MTPLNLESLAIVGHSVYWLDDPLLLRIDLDGHGMATIGQFGDPHHLVAKDGALYFLTHPKVEVLRPGAASVEEIFVGLLPLDGLAVDASNVFVGSYGGGLWRIPRAGGAPMTLPQARAGCVTGVDDSFVYFVSEDEWATPAMSLYATPKHEGPDRAPGDWPRLLAKGVRFCQATLAPTGLYAATYVGEIIAVDPATRETHTLADGQMNASALITHGGYLYWATPAGIYRVAEAGGPVTEVVSDPGVRDLDFAEAEMVWLSKAGVFKMPIP